MAGRLAELRLTVSPSLEDPKSGIDRVVADLSALGGVPDPPLRAIGSGAYAADLSLRVDRPGLHEIRVAIDQSTVMGHPWIELSRLVAVRPQTAAQDLVILGDGAHADWHARVSDGARSRCIRRKLQPSTSGLSPRPGQPAGEWVGRPTSRWIHCPTALFSSSCAVTTSLLTPPFASGSTTAPSTW